jgi:hypothetical protein
VLDALNDMPYAEIAKYLEFRNKGVLTEKLKPDPAAIVTSIEDLASDPLNPFLRPINV